MNFGRFVTPERRVNLRHQRFDETLPAPWEWNIPDDARQDQVQAAAG
jgi:hypothetical protein